jgi:hypothetical protein
MWKRIILAGVLGAVAMTVWAFLVNGIFWFTKDIAMKEIPDERAVYEVLKKNIIAPGRYVCNPAIVPPGMFPLNEPVFGITYSGEGHEAAGREQLVHLAIAFLASLIAAWMLSVASDRILSSYFRRALFFAVIGLLFAVFSDLQKAGISSYPLHDALLWAAYDVAMWTVVGFVVAWCIKPAPGAANAS